MAWVVLVHTPVTLLQHLPRQGDGEQVVVPPKN